MVVILSSNTSVRAMMVLRMTLQSTSTPKHHSIHSSTKLSPAPSTSSSHHSPPSTSSPTSSPPSSSHDPLIPSTPTNHLGLPLTPLPLSIPSFPPSTKITPTTLHRLHRLSALNPPISGSEEETQLVEEMNGLVGLMDLVQEVKLDPGDVGGLLGEGFGEVVIDETSSAEGPAMGDTSGISSEEQSSGHIGIERGGEERGEKKGEKKGKELLDWATRRMGEHYAYRPPKRKE